MNPPEEWRDVVGYEGFYKVSDLGRVLSEKRNGTNGGIIALVPDKDGYLLAHLSAYNKKAKWRVQELVITAFAGECPAGKTQINHKNGIKADNTPDNLEWCTGKENIRHAYAMGLASQSCDRNNSAKINGAVAISIFNAIGKQDDIAKQYGVHQATVSGIKLGKQWGASTGAPLVGPMGPRIGQKNANVKITEKQAIEIFHAMGRYRDVGDRYGVSGENVYRIKNGKSWKYLNLLAGQCA